MPTITGPPDDSGENPQSQNPSRDNPSGNDMGETNKEDIMAPTTPSTSPAPNSTTPIEKITMPPETQIPTTDVIDKDNVISLDRNWDGLSNGGGGKTTSVLATNMILYDACSSNQDIAVRVLAFNSLSVESVSVILYAPNTISVGVDVTSHAMPSNYVRYSNNPLNYVYSIFDVTVPLDTTKFFVTLSDKSDARMTSSVLVDLSNSDSVCTGALFPHDLPDDTASFISNKNGNDNPLLDIWRKSIP